MSSTKPISVALGKKHREILQRQIESGRYETASDVVSEALTLMTERDAVFDAWLRDEVRASLADLRPTRTADDTFKRIRTRVARAGSASRRAS